MLPFSRYLEIHSMHSALKNSIKCFMRKTLSNEKRHVYAYKYTYHIKSWQCEQNVGCLRKVAINLCPFTWWILRRIAPLRRLKPCLSMNSRRGSLLEFILPIKLLLLQVLSASPMPQVDCESEIFKNIT